MPVSKSGIVKPIAPYLGSNPDPTLSFCLLLFNVIPHHPSVWFVVRLTSPSLFSKYQL